MWIGIITLFPEMFQAVIHYGVVGRAVKKKLLNIECWNPRNFVNQNYVVDDRPYGGGPGMVMTAYPLRNAIHAAKNKAGGKAKVIYLSPQGRTLNQQGANELATNARIILVCGRYKGIDERLCISEIDEEWSIGDYVLSGGELAAMVMIDSVSRLIPGVLGHSSSAEQDSFSKGMLLDCPHYTRPRLLDNTMAVPHVLLSGNHNKIHRWRLKQSLGRTWLRRPEILESITLSKEQVKLLVEFQSEYWSNNTTNVSD
ncbi:tRNA (guanosine(37)-N1)-methyltransferase TrmD [Sodalis sp. CWE]|uniref:tRNA (guanosine(37)-N1)-methyltransferase TrmD n=1 Tax=Sodalis sp. CWE TaxID=2803816 RepID=UPI001C7D51D4|nr:tRNA (guanosine(37)-N1)-methyltransferase TrmD [Sodalis sp. CWE]MBX4180979.1 tRNA (guanosine(37)-N1)-methyltransferase TrmD [Sodalis sp. CWE]